MRHVPEEELHAYLDQALSRSQCVEIETHLARCGACREARDETAALRDRTTALLAALTPRPLIIPPPVQELASRQIAVIVPAHILRYRRIGLWAAGLAAAVGAGWLARSATVSPTGAPTERAFVEQAATIAPALDAPKQIELKDTPAAEPAAAEPRQLVQVHPRKVTTDEASLRAPEVPGGPVPVSATPQSFDGSLSAPPIVSPPANDIYRVVAWEEALALTGGRVPHIAGLIVETVHLRPGARGEAPTVIVVQGLPSGERLQSIEGPVYRVTEILRQPREPGENASRLIRMDPDYVKDPSGGHTRSHRVLAVVGRLSVDSLTMFANMARVRQ